MRKYQSYISLILVIGLFFGLFHQTATIIHFYMNQDEIAAEHCVNKNNPEKKSCHGQCHLKAELKASSPDQNENNDGVTTLRTSILVFMFAPVSAGYYSLEAEKNNWINLNTPGTPCTFHSEIFHPPQNVV